MPHRKLVAGPAADTRLAHQRRRRRPGSTSTAPPGSGMPPMASRMIGMTTVVARSVYRAGFSVR